MDDSSKNKNTNANLHLHDALKNINDALEQWDKITNKPTEGQADSLERLKRPNQDELFLKLKDQLAGLSDDSAEDTPEEPVENHDHI